MIWADWFPGLLKDVVKLFGTLERLVEERLGETVDLRSGEWAFLNQGFLHLSYFPPL